MLLFFGGLLINAIRRLLDVFNISIMAKNIIFIVTNKNGFKPGILKKYFDKNTRVNIIIYQNMQQRKLYKMRKRTII